MGKTRDDRSEMRRLSRELLIEGLLRLGRIEGRLDLLDFLHRTWDLHSMPSNDPRFKTADGDIWQHMVNNPGDMEDEVLYKNYLDLPGASDDILLEFLKNVVHPMVRTPDEQPVYVAFINEYLEKEGFELRKLDVISGFQTYGVARIGSGVSSNVKNIIFAANGPKPRIVLRDAVSNDIAIVENERYCLVYDRPLPQQGLRWTDLVEWWAEREGLPNTRDTALALYDRLKESLSPKSPPERLLFNTFFRSFHKELGPNLPALIPQVYLHYDPYTIKELGAAQNFARQRMDFLLLLSCQVRVVIEVDGVQHYADGGKPSPKRYAEMVAADRDLRLAGYEVYRFGGSELKDPKACESFFRRLFQKHGIRNGAQA